MSIADGIRETERWKCSGCWREKFFVFVIIGRKRQVWNACCSFGWWWSISKADFAVIDITIKISDGACSSAWAPWMQSVLDSSLWLVPHLWQIVATEEHEKRTDELVRLLLPFLDEVNFNIVNHFFAFMLHLIKFVLQSEFLFAKEWDV